MTDIDHKAVFFEEARELLADLEEALLELENAPEDKELIGRIFRAMHTIKGSGAMFGFEAVAAFTHEIETFYDKVREGQIKVTPELINITLVAKDQILELLQTSTGEVPTLPTDTIAALNSLASGREPAVIPPPREAVPFRRGFTHPLK